MIATPEQQDPPGQHQERKAVPQQELPVEFTKGFSASREMMLLKAKMAEKKLKVIESTGSVPKLGRNDFNKYDYAMAADTFEIVRKALSVGIAITAEVLSVESVMPKEGAKQILTKIWMLYSLTDTETGYTEWIRWPGEAADTGDKGLYKAMTNALKYFCFQQFILPTGLDVETDSPELTGDKPNATPKKLPPYKGRRSGEDFYGYQGNQQANTPSADDAPQSDKPPMVDQIADALLGKEPDEIASDNALPPYSEKSKKIMDGLFDYYKAKIHDMEGFAFNALKLRAKAFALKNKWPETAVGATTVKTKIAPQEVADPV